MKKRQIYPPIPARPRRLACFVWACSVGALFALFEARSAEAFITMAHRGGRIEEPENTVPAFLDSLSRGVDWVECDLRSSGDGVLICLHDEDLARVTNGVYTGLVDSYTFAELRLMNVCDRHCDVYTPENPAIIPTFQEVLLAVQGKGILLLDIKLTADVSQARAELAAVGGVEGDVVGWIRYNQVGRDFRTYFPNSMALIGISDTGLLDQSVMLQWASLGYAGMLIHEAHLTQGGGTALVDQIHSFGLLVGVWGALPYNFAELMSYGPDGLVNQNAQALVDFKSAHACIDDLDNDADGATDFREDVDCLWPLDLSEVPDCNDGLDNDADGQVDGLDPDCESALDPAEEPACSDRIDNDGDGLIDWPEDPGCLTPNTAFEDTTIPALSAVAAVASMLALMSLGTVALRRRARAG